MSSEPLGVGLVGAGQMGRIHAANLAAGRISGARLAAVADADAAVAGACAAEHDVPALSVGSLVNDDGVRAIVIASPGNTHAGIIETAARVGKHVFTEKPLDTDLGRIDRALSAVREARVALQVGFNRRFDANFARVREAVSAGRVGDPYVLHIISRDPVWRVPPVIDGLSGLLFDTTIHDFDMCRHLVGDVESVYVLGAPAVHKADVPDTITVSLRFANGALGLIENGQAVFGYDQRLELFGSNGAVRVDNEHPDRVPAADREGVHSPLPQAFYAQRYAASYVAELQAFVDCIRDGAEPPVSGADGRAAVVIALAAQRSLDEGRPVRVDEIS